jgi:nucleoside-diphosphate-sugar epimerase
MLQLLRAVARGWPLPLASIRNRRSLVFVGNLVDAITAAIESPAAAGHTYLVSDGEDLSTPELVRVLAAALGASAALVPFPPPLLRLGGALLGRSAAVARLTGSLQIDSSRIRHELGWTPRYSLSDGMKLMAQWYHARSGLRPSY